MGKIRYFENHTGSVGENCSSFGQFFLSQFCLLFRLMSEIPLVFTESACMACLHIVLSINIVFKFLNIPKIKQQKCEREKNSLFSKSVGLALYAFRWLKNVLSNKLNYFFLGAYYKLYMYSAIYLSTNHET